MIFLTAPFDIQNEMAYEVALETLGERYGIEQIKADRELFSSVDEYHETWQQVYDPENAVRLYILAREDGSIDNKVYRQWKWLSEDHSVPATVLLLATGSYDEDDAFTVSLVEESKQDDEHFALVNPSSPGLGFPGRFKQEKVNEGEVPQRGRVRRFLTRGWR